ncbi:MAG: hypothetical protein ACTSP4_11830 [Candidatus Hodarchaeales archaeon]
MGNIMIDFTSYRKEMPPDKVNDYKFVFALTRAGEKKVAFHRADADGVVSAVIVKKAFPGEKLVFIPLGLEAINRTDFGSYLMDLNWHSVVDLPPFNKKKCKLISDHHRSSESMQKNAEIVLFDPEAPSAAYLLAKHFKDIDNETRELARLTEITDTASFTIPAPLQVQEEYSTEQERAWAINDLCKALESSQRVLELVERLADEGFKAIPKHYNRKLAEHRSLRKKSIDLISNLKCKELTIIILDKNTMDDTSMLHELLSKGAKVGISMVRLQSSYKMRLRHSKTLSREENIMYRVDDLAGKLNGGGHIAASGARVRDSQKALDIIISWAKMKKLDFIIHRINLK